MKLRAHEPQGEMITLDTSALLALFNRADQHHDAAVARLDADPGPYLVPAGILAEVAYMLEVRHGAEMLDSFLADLESGAFTLHCGERDLPRIRALARRYRDLALGFSDAAVIACAEGNGGLVLTFDRRDFDVVAREGTISAQPSL
ncbi:MAG: type II toxin-antitoxin system VapC family toxin [Solirubrobacteraceae bacterium]